MASEQGAGKAPGPAGAESLHAAGPSAPALDQEEQQEEAPSTELTDLEAAKDADALLKAFFSDLKDVDRDNEVNRILWAFKLNPYEKLNLRFDCPVEDIRRQFRKLSLMVHPDKCKHANASTAFELLGDAMKELLDDEKRESLLKILQLSREEVRKERKKETKHDNVVKLTTLLNEEGRAGVEAVWEKSEEFHEKWKVKAQAALAAMEWRKRRGTKRMKEETLRIEGEEKEARLLSKKVKADAKEWEATREQRVGTWRDFVTNKQTKAVNELKAPKQRANDDDKLYVRRPVREEELRPVAPPSRKANNAPKAQQPPATL